MSKNRTRPDTGFCNQKKLPKGPNRRNLCRWCQAEVPKGRRTYCGDNCVHEWRIRSDPVYARSLVFRRDQGVCAACGTDCEKTLHTLSKLRGVLHKPLLSGQERLQSDLNLAAMLKELQLRGFRVSESTRFSLPASLWDCDHIIPVAEGGGECGLENLRTLCHPCHRAVTAALRKRLAQQRKKTRQLTIVEL